MLTDDEKWFFDLQGYLILKQVVTPEQVGRMVELCDNWHGLPEAELPPPLSSYEDPATNPKAARAILDPEYADPEFDSLILNHGIMRAVLDITDNAPQHLLSALTLNTAKSDEIVLHGGASGVIRNPANDYQAGDGRVFATFLNAAISLVDVPPGSGFVCIPGSHKSYFERPEHINIRTGPPTVANITLNAGDAILFTEALCHGALPWTCTEEPRRTVFVRYSTSYASWSPGVGPKEEYRDKISEDVYQLKQQWGFQGKKPVVERLIKEIGEAQEAAM